MAEDESRLKFDIAFALAVLSPVTDFPLGLPKNRELAGPAMKLLQDCIAPDSYDGSNCNIRNDASAANYHLRIGNDRLGLFPGGQVRAGGSGVTVQLYDTSLDRSYALKVPRMSVLAYKMPTYETLDEDHLQNRVNSEFEAFENERRISRLLSHENIARHFYGDVRTIRGVGGSAFSTSFPYSVSEWIDGALPLHKYLLKHKPNQKQVLALLRDAFSALAHTHHQNIIHWDIKSDNLLISLTGVAKLIDFGNAKILDSSAGAGRSATTSKGKYPQIAVLKPAETGMDESRRFRISMPDPSWNHQFIDLWMMAQEWNRCLGFSEFVQGESELTPTQQESTQEVLRLDDSSRTAESYDCLRLIFDRILYPFSVAGLTSVVNSDNSFNEASLYYKTADDILNEMSRIDPPFGAAEEVPELLASLDEIVRLPVTGNSVFTKRVAAVVDSKIVQSTVLHYQLAQVRQVFPGATHSRFEHLLGTVTTAAYFVRSLYLNNTNAFWRVSTTSADVRSLLLASILHDAGHLAFGHFIEEMDIMSGAKHGDYIVCFLDRCIELMGGTAKEGRDSPDSVFEIANDEVLELTEIARHHWCSEDSNHIGTDAEVIALLEQTAAFFGETKPAPTASVHLTRAGTRRALDAILKSIVDGPMDADKLDYLRRDSLHSGVFFANGIDLERFFESLRACVNTSSQGAIWQPSIGVSEKGVAPAETIITARYHLYSTVYWHRTVRCITAMLQRLISELRLLLGDEEWNHFLRTFLDKFRRMDDRQAIEWLKQDLEERKLLGTALSSAETKRPGGVSKIAFSDVISALVSNHQRRFRMAFELSYVGPTDPRSLEGKTAREQLHDYICADTHPTTTGTGRAWSDELGKESRRVISEVRKDLERRFEQAISKELGREWFLDTILLDVPEPGKDQIKGLIVDQRSKRSRRGRIGLSVMENVGQNYVDIISVSPIAATLATVFSRWARKVRIFMASDDLEQLRKLHLEAGDVAAIWERVLYAKYNIDPSQPIMRLH